MSRATSAIALLVASSFACSSACVSARVESPTPSSGATEEARPPPAQPAVPAPHIGLANAATPAPASSAAVATPDLAPGQSRAEVRGCAAATGESEAQKFVSRTRGISPPPTVQAIPRGAQVEHPLDHTCCLTVAVTSRMEGDTAIVRETLSGSPCRCRCSSTIKTTVGLEPGNWKVAIEVEDAQGLRRVHEQSIEVRP